MRSELLQLGASFAFLTAVLPAQNTVPAAMLNVEGGGGTNIPFGSTLACRYQCIYDAEELPWVGPRVLTGILLRADNNVLNTAMPAKGFLDISLVVSTTDRNSATASSVFEENYGTDATWVITHQQMQLPAQPALATAPRPANIPFLFTVPWAYGLTPATTTLPAPKNLLVEIWVHSQPAGLYKIDNLSGCTAVTTTFGLAGPGCAEAGGQPLTLGGDPSMQAGQTYAWQLTNAAPGMPFLLSLDLTDTGNLLGNPAWPLPYPMFDPQNPSLPSAALASLVYPAPDCYLNVNLAAFLAGITDSTGLGSVTGTLPPGRQFVGTTLFTQAIVLSPTANALHLITSPGYSSTVCGPLGVTRIHTFYNASQTTPPTSGQLQYGAGLIFDVQ